MLVFFRSETSNLDKSSTKSPSIFEFSYFNFKSFNFKSFFENINFEDN